MTRCDWDPSAAKPAERVYVPVGDVMKPMDTQTGCQSQATVKLPYGGAWLNLCDRCFGLGAFRFVRGRARRIEKDTLVNER